MKVRNASVRRESAEVPTTKKEGPFRWKDSWILAIVVLIGAMIIYPEPLKSFNTPTPVDKSQITIQRR